VFGLLSGLVGLYRLGRGLEVGDRAAAAIQRVHDSVYAGRLTTLTYAVAGALLLVGGASGYEAVHSTAAAGPFGAVEVLATLAVQTAPWLTAAAVASSVGRIADTYLDGRFEWRYLNAPFYALAVGAVLRALGAYLLGRLGLSAVVVTLVGGTLLAATSTLAFAVAESRTDRPRAMRAP
jgi:putative membrane protein